MSLLESAQGHVRHTGGKCAVPVVLSSLPDDEKAELLSWLDGPGVPSATAIVGALKERGLLVGASSLNRHRRRDCQCR